MTNIFNLRTMPDFQREEEEFAMRRQAEALKKQQIEQELMMAPLQRQKIEAELGALNNPQASFGFEGKALETQIANGMLRDLVAGGMSEEDAKRQVGTWMIGVRHSKTDPLTGKRTAPQLPTGSGGIPPIPMSDFYGGTPMSDVPLPPRGTMGEQTLSNAHAPQMGMAANIRNTPIGHVTGPKAFINQARDVLNVLGFQEGDPRRNQAAAEIARVENDVTMALNSTPRLNQTESEHIRKGVTNTLKPRMWKTPEVMRKDLLSIVDTLNNKITEMERQNASGNLHVETHAQNNISIEKLRSVINALQGLMTEYNPSGSNPQTGIQPIDPGVAAPEQPSRIPADVQQILQIYGN